MKNYNWAVLGTGVIANETAAAMQKNGRNLFAVGNRTHGKAVAFAEKYNIISARCMTAMTKCSPTPMSI